MEYPIIDTLTNAYIRNGWTGLEIQYGKNLFDADTIYNQFLQEDGTFSGMASQIHAIRYDIPNELLNMQLTFSVYVKANTGTTPNNIRAYAYVNGKGIDGNFVTSSTFKRSVVTFTPTSTNDYIRITYGSGGSNIMDFKYVQLEMGDNATDYEPYSIKTDIFSRTRLPLIRYFPHPVVDSLKRAADGTMTSNDVQVLRHYLSKFGIGNIELGRFYALNSNVSNDIKEIDMEPILIDKPIKEKKTEEEGLNGKTE